MAGTCLGNTKDHCCYVNGVTCKHLRDDGVDAKRRWVCTLLTRYGSWEFVHTSVEYTTDVKPHWEKSNTADCGDYPRKGEQCGECKQIGI